MKIALISDSLVEFGGAEKVVIELINLFPQAKVFTNYYKRELTKKHFPFLNKNNFRSSWFQFFPKKTTTTVQLFSPLIWHFDELRKFDLVLTSSTSDLCPIATLNLKHTVHYIHSLPKNLFGLERMSFWQRKLPLSFQKRLYYQSLKDTPHLVVNSYHTQKSIKEVLGLETTVIYPPVAIPSKKIPSSGRKDYFLIISRLEKEKGIELAILACQKLNLHLKIAGEARNINYLNNLKRLAKKNTDFLGFVSEKEKENLYQKAIAFLFCSENEDFGIAPVEAMAHGVPVIAYFGGGAKETIIEGKTGLFFYRHNWQSLAKTIEKCKKFKFKSENLSKQAKKFSKEEFKKKFTDYLKDSGLLS